MKSLEEYKISQSGWMKYECSLCSVAASVGYLEQFSKLDSRINELVLSFLNQWHFVVVTYDKLCKQLGELNSKSDEPGINNAFSEYDAAATEMEQDFKSHSYLLIISIKTYLDLFACLIDIAVNKEIREEGKLPDLYKLGFSKNDKITGKLLIELSNIRDRGKHLWIEKVREIRNKIVHQGYSIKPIFLFKKSDNLQVKIFKGTDMYVTALEIDIAELFNDFITQMPGIENAISDILTQELLKSKQPVKVVFRNDGSLSEYSFSESDID